MISNSHTQASAGRWVLATAFAVTLGGLGCAVEHPLEPGVFSLEISPSTSVEGERFGDASEPLPYGAANACFSPSDCEEGQSCYQGTCAYEYTFDVRAKGRDGRLFPFRGPVNVRVTPGRLLGPSEPLIMTDGSLDAVKVYIAQGIGKTHIWFEADGYLRHERDYGQCNDGIDNDLNGLIDLADSGCASADDDLEAPVELATGVSPTLYFANPTIRDLQLSERISTSPLVGEQVRVDSGNLVVSNVVANGFYLVDLNDNQPDRLYASIFIFTFSKPKDIYYGDRICRLSGAVQEHVGMTQLVFPSFEAYYPENDRCDDFEGLDPNAQVPEPWPLTDMLVREDIGTPSFVEQVSTNTAMLEAYEGNLVTFTDIDVSTRFIACDRNENGRIDNSTAEDTCRDECQDDPLCTDLEGYFQYSQWSGVTAGKKKIQGSTALAEEFKPLDISFIGEEDASGRCEREITADDFISYTCPPLKIASLTGSLRHIYLCMTNPPDPDSRCTLQMWVVDPRFDGDVTLAE